MTVIEVAEALAQHMGVDIHPDVTGQFRAGDVRHCWADTTKAADLLGFEPQVAFREGMAELVEWVASETATDRVEAMQVELVSRGLAR